MEDFSEDISEDKMKLSLCLRELLLQELKSVEYIYFKSAVSTGAGNWPVHKPELDIAVQNPSM